MTKEDKELLLEDICSRLPYGVKCQVQEDEYTYIGTLCRIEVDNKNGHLLDFAESISGLDCQVYLSEIKPYLFPLSSMTEEQEKDIFHNGTFFFDRHNTLCRFPKHNDDCDYVTFEDYLEITEKLNKHHIDYRGLIDKGLAIDATNLNI